MKFIGGGDEDGVGFRYKETDDLIADCGLLLGVSSLQVSDAVRGIDLNQSSFDHDFMPRPDGLPAWQVRDTERWQSIARFDDNGAPAPIGLQVTQECIQYTRSPYDDFVLLRYTVRNAGLQRLDDLRLGFVADWSIERSSCCDGNAKAVDPEHDLGYAWNTKGAARGADVGIAVLTAPGLTAYQVIDDGKLFRSGFSTAEKWASLSRGIDPSGPAPGNLSMAVGTGPFTIEPDASITVGL